MQRTHEVTQAYGGLQVTGDEEMGIYAGRPQSSKGIGIGDTSIDTLDGISRDLHSAWKPFTINQLREDARHGAGEGNRTLVSSLGSYSSTIELRPRCPTSLCGARVQTQRAGPCSLPVE